MLGVKLIVLFITFLIWSGNILTVVSYNNDLNLQTPDIIKKHGYPVETHVVLTEDGYILVVHRIPYSPTAPRTEVKTPILLQHGFLLASDSWVVTGPEQGLGFLLADHGYDVWLGNSRGNIYSRHHLIYPRNDERYWDFSWHEMGYYDLPAVINYILKVTYHQQLSYVGFSMGSTIFFVMASTRPEFNEKIRGMVALGPIVFDGLPNQYIQPLSINKAIHLSQSQSQTSIHAIDHYYQIFKTDRFQFFDRDARQRGFVEFKPEYNLSLVTAPVDIMYAERDDIVTPDGIKKLKESLPNAHRILRVKDNQAGHGVFLFDKDVLHLIYDHVFAMLH